MKLSDKNAVLLLRLGLAFTFLYAAIASFLNPNSWIGFLPPFLTSIIAASTLLVIFSVYEIILGVWLLSGKKLFYSSLLSALTMIGIILPNIGAMDIVFRDIAILFMALALLSLSHKNN